MKNKCDFILPFFVSKDGQPGAGKPYDGKDGYIYATNREASIRVPKTAVIQNYVLSEREWHPDVKGLFETTINAPGVRAATIEQADILAALTKEGHLPFVKIGAQTFAENHLRAMFTVSVYTGSERIIYRAGDGPRSPGLFEIGGGITILLLPTLMRIVRVEEVRLSDIV
jgi:hypothetical protein